MNVKDKFVVAVSGGVDSVVLLHKLATRLDLQNPKSPTYIIAHFDHGVREDSNMDAELVEKLAADYKLEFELGSGNLGADVSEADARDARYEFLRSVMAKHEADMIITAHHQDDILETMVINMVRGTGPRGLSPMTQPDILRPLLNRTKVELLEYASEHKLEWREDSTNTDDKYLRNNIRLNIMPKLSSAREELVSINKRIGDIYQDIDIRIANLLPSKNILYRPGFVVLPYSLQREIIRSWLVRSGIKDIDRELIERCTMACKTLPIGKKIDVGNALWLISDKQNLALVSK
jgi:tRNA(Ile)-lysidine synthetase-like protein